LRKRILIFSLLFFFSLSSTLAIVCEPPPTNPFPEYPQITILSPLEGETYSFVEISTEIISNQEIDFWGYILNEGKYISFSPNQTIKYEEGENKLVIYGSNENGFARDYVNFYVNLGQEPPEEPYCGDGVCSLEIGENQSSCPQDCGYPPNNGDDDNGDDDESGECCCCTSQGFVEYGTPFESKKIISSSNIVEGKPIVLNQTFGNEKKIEIEVYILIGLLILLSLLLIVWLILRN
jgi:ribosomal protein L30E